MVGHSSAAILSTADWYVPYIVARQIEERIKRGKGVIGLYKGKTPPTNVPAAFKANGCKAVEWSHEAINKAIEEASKHR